MSKKQETIESLWETLAGAAHDLRHYLRIKDKKRYQQSFEVMEKTLEALRLLS